MDIAGAVAVVTGAGGGLGEVIAGDLADRGAVVIVARAGLIRMTTALADRPDRAGVRVNCVVPDWRAARVPAPR